MHEESDGRSRVHFPKELRRELCQEWRLALIIKYLGKNINFHVLQQRLPSIWGLQGRLHLIDIGFGCFVARFDNKKDYLHVLLDGPWKIFDNYLITQRWVPDFKARTAKFAKMAVWVRLPELSVEYFRDDTIKIILGNIGKPLKLDRTTLMKERGRFARAAVEVDLDKPLVSEIWVRDEVQPVIYEGLHMVCFGCGVIGHWEQDCSQGKTVAGETTTTDLPALPESEKDGDQRAEPVAPKKSQAVERQRYGSWMLVTRKSNPPKQYTNPRREKHQSSTTNRKGNQFASLAEVNNNANLNHISRPKGKSPGDAAGVPSRKASPPPSNSGHNPNPTAPPKPNGRHRSDRQVAMPNGNGRGGGRGGNQPARRGKGKYVGKGVQTNVAETSAAGAWRGSLENAGIFQFGGWQAPSTELPTTNPHNFDGGSSSRSTLGEGGHQTSTPSNRSL
ncbi:uncharacterized protein LOC116023587 [Ipomoea triloba]|uniref:uncharacterized protein LOC116023587 n=1 Tax=Ipomoea triloba TaxID=35885 RepID=UPI00125DF357|nr:uncharacterized protein LOC116023587 [Ipomoea triloba]